MEDQKLPLPEEMIETVAQQVIEEEKQDGLICQLPPVTPSAVVIPSRERIINALREYNAPQWMILNADTGVYDSFDGRKKLLKHLQKTNNEDMIRRMGDGEFNHTVNDIEAMLRKHGWRPGQNAVQKPQRRGKNMQSLKSIRRGVRP